jgi:hypothetical protein
MNNNFFKNLGIGRQVFINKWVETSDTTDLQYNRIKLNKDLNFRVVKQPELVLGNIIYHVIKKKDLPECIVYDFKRFSTLHLGDVNRFKRSNCLFDDVNSIDDWIKLLNIIDDHIINLTEISFIESVSDSSNSNKVFIFKKLENNDWRILL